MAEECPFVAGARITVPILDLKTGKHLCGEDGKPMFEQRQYGDPVPEAVHFRKLAQLVTRGKILLRTDYVEKRRRPLRRRIFRRYRDVMKAIGKIDAAIAARAQVAEQPPEPVAEAEKPKAEAPSPPKEKKRRPRNREEATKGAAAGESAGGDEPVAAPGD